MVMSVENLEKLDAWKKAKEFALAIYKDVIPLLPPEEKWGLAQQLRLSAQSIPANIAEGFGRYYYQENVRFCYIARGSLEETISHLILAHELNFIPKELFLRLSNRSDDLAKLINGYIGYLKRSKQGNNEPGSFSAIHEFSEQYI
jgi:four helix bundle protein